MNIRDYLGDWYRFIDKAELEVIGRILEGEYKKEVIFPQKEDIFKAFHLCPYKDLKVVMIGQDPYPQNGIATGILFGNKPDTPESKLSPSLRVVKEACIDYTIPHGNVIFDNTFESWCSQGILMLNSALTVRWGRVGSHTDLWRDFMSKLITNISETDSGIIWVLFGETAASLRKYIINSPYICQELHPAFYARKGIRMSSYVFDYIDGVLKRNNNLKIKWYEEKKLYIELENLRD